MSCRLPAAHDSEIIFVDMVGGRGLPTDLQYKLGSEWHSVQARHKLSLRADSAGSFRLQIRAGTEVHADLQLRRGRQVIAFIPSQMVLDRGRFADSAVGTAAMFQTGSKATSLIPAATRAWRAFPVVVTASGIRAVRGETNKAGDMVGSAVAQLNAAAGVELFQVPMHSSDRVGVRIVLDSAMSDALGRAGVSPPACPYEDRMGYLCQPAWIDSVVVRIAATADVHDLQHELLHGLGMSHTCVVPSVMATEFTTEELRACQQARAELGLRGGLRLRRRLGVHDAAAALLLWRLAKELNGLSASAVHWIMLP